MENEGMELEIIVNPKVTEDGQSVIQVRLSLNVPSLPSFSLLNELSVVGNCGRCSHQAFQECSWYQRSPKPFPTRQELFGFTLDQE